MIELVGGFMIGSRAIVAGAVHDLGDALSLGSAWLLEKYSNRGRDENFNFGYRRFSLLSALLGTILVTATSAIIIFESSGSLYRIFEGKSETPAPAAPAMLALALIGVAVNGFSAWRLSRGSSFNERVMSWHQVEDLLGWVSVLIGAIAISLTGQAWIDPLLAIGISLFVLFNVLRSLKGMAYLFLQGRPSNFNQEKFVAEALAVQGVERVDHVAVWSLDGDTNILSARLHLHSVRDPDEIEKVKANVRAVALRQRAQATLETCMAEHVHGPNEDDTH